MSPVCLEHDKNYTSCHHCHLTSPIPLSELIRTHPLRSVVAKENKREDVSRKSSSRKKEETINEEEYDVQSLLDEAANNAYRLRKLRSISSTSDEGSPSKSLSRKSTDNEKFVKPVHSFLHHESNTSAYKDPLVPSTSYKTGTIQSKQSRKSSCNHSSSGVILDPRALELPSTHSSHNKHYSSIRKYSKPQREFILKDIETQTSRNNSILNGHMYDGRPTGSDVSLLTILNHKHSKQKRCDKFFCSLPSGLLFAGYGLLIVIGIVIAVALSQRERRISLASSSLPQRPVSFSGAKPVPIGEGRIAIRKPPSRRRINPAIKKTVKPAHRVASDIIPIPPLQPLPAQPRPAPAHASSAVTGVPLQIFREDEFDYFDNIGFNDQDFLLPKSNVQAHPAQQVPQPSRPPQQAFRPVEIEPQFRPQAPIPSPTHEVRTVARVVPRQQQETAPRRTVPNTLKQEFNINDNQRAQRGHKEPAVKIVKSWSNRNADGTFSWGYINTDGSFKNETKGSDCVVRGIYGYVDETTGETLTFPYVSGNPCDPNKPDVYYDYDDGTVNQGGQIVNQPKNAAQVVVRRRP